VNESSFPLLISSFNHDSPWSYTIWGMNSRAVGGRRSKTYTHPINMIIILCEYEDSGEIRSSCLDKHFMELSNNDKILLCKILYFVEGTGTTRGMEKMGMHNRSENGHSASVTHSI
jgi:hypothetical protein